MLKSLPRIFSKTNLFLLILAILASTILINWLFIKESSWYEKSFLIGSSVCHQIPSHSYHSDTQQFPLCARCSGLYLGSLIGIIYYSLQGRKAGLPKKIWIILLVVLFLIWGVDGVNSLASDLMNRPFLYTTTNITRLVTGYGMGLVMSTALITLFNITIWKDISKQPLLNSFWQVFGYVGISTITTLLLINSNPILFLVLAFASLLSVLLIITLLYTIFWVIVFRREGQFDRLANLGLFLLAGFSTALIQIALLNTLRAQILI